MSPQPPTDGLRDSPAREVEDHEDTDQSSGGKMRRRHRRISALSLAVALLFFFGPAIAFAFGDRAAAIENRRLAGMPSLDSGWKLIPGFNSWAVDHLPLRAEAVRADTYLSEAVFDEPPLSSGHTTSGIGSVAAGNNTAPNSAGNNPTASAAPRVIQGKDGWLYIADDFSLACDPKLSLPAVIDGIRRLHTAVEASGRKLVFSVIPDKSTAVPQNLPKSYAFKNCSEERRKEFWPDLGASKVPFVDLRKPLAAGEHAAGHPMYLSLNTHWNMQGAAIWSKSVLTALDGKLTQGLAIPGVDAGPPSGESSFVAGPEIPAEGDLTVMLGAPRTEPTLKITLDRKGVALSSDGAPLPGNVPPPLDARPAGTPVTTEASTTAAPLYPGHTLLLGDSFYNVFGRSLFTPFMSNLTAAWVMRDPAMNTQSIIDADTVVLEVAERNLASGKLPLIHPNALAELETSLAAHHL